MCWVWDENFVEEFFLEFKIRTKTELVRFDVYPVGGVTNMVRLGVFVWGRMENNIMRLEG